MTATAIEIAAECAKVLREIAELHKAMEAALLPAIEAAKLRNNEAELREMAALLPADSSYAEDLIRAAELAASRLSPLGKRPSLTPNELLVGTEVMYSDNYLNEVGQYTKSADAAIGVIVGFRHYSDGGKYKADTWSADGVTIVQVRWTWKNYDVHDADQGDGVHYLNLSKVS
jgi:hypothetical protein